MCGGAFIETCGQTQRKNTKKKHKKKTLKQRFKAFSLVDGTGLERIYVDFAGCNSHIRPEYSPFFVLFLP